MARGAEIAAFTGVGQQEIAAATLAEKTDKTCVQVATGQVPDHDLFEVGPPVCRACLSADRPGTGRPEAEVLLEPLRVDLLERLEMILNARVVRGQMRLSGPVDRAGFGQWVCKEGNT
jgi:hypothetical protein